MDSTPDDVRALLDLLPDDSPAVELIAAALEDPDDPTGAMQVVVSSWATECESEEEST